MTAGKRRSVAVYCGSSFGIQKAFYKAAISLGKAIAADGRSLVYGGGSDGIMGVVSTTVAENGGNVTGFVPYAMVAAGGEKEKITSNIAPDVQSNGSVTSTIVVGSMHDRKIAMAKHADGFIGLPGGLGTFEEILEVTTWTQLGIHNKPVVLANICGFWDPLRQLINTATGNGYIRPESAKIIAFVDGPANYSEHEDYDWGKAVLDALDDWIEIKGRPMFDWSRRLGVNITDTDKLTAT
ncbi:hypothetical protein AX15_003908 [Amanita polypyramis BW_CC]|nr:hypothetical protein AX15_003908 [Amanita polypyramis BW_CC]